MLERREIRELALKKLANSKELRKFVSARNIVDSKVSPFSIAQLPGVNVVTPTQNGTQRSLNVPVFANSLKLNIEIYVEAMNGWVAKADEIAEVIENCLLCDPEFTQKAQIQNFDVEYQILEGAKPMVVEILSLTLEFGKEYEPIINDELETVNIKVDVIEPIANPLPGPDGRKEFELNINFQEGD